jgi:hypothetical protein
VGDVGYFRSKAMGVVDSRRDNTLCRVAAVVPGEIERIVSLFNL